MVHRQIIDCRAKIVSFLGCEIPGGQEDHAVVVVDRVESFSGDEVREHRWHPKLILQADQSPSIRALIRAVPGIAAAHGYQTVPLYVAHALMNAQTD